MSHCGACGEELADFAWGKLHLPEEGSIEVDKYTLGLAVAAWRQGRATDALHHLENALGREFIGLGDLKLQDHP